MEYFFINSGRVSETLEYSTHIFLGDRIFEWTTRRTFEAQLLLRSMYMHYRSAKSQYIRSLVHQRIFPFGVLIENTTINRYLITPWSGNGQL